jgi:4-hydroxy-tetrahydrodipicolinate synthase
MSSSKPGGVWAPAITPFKADLSPDPERYARHARWLLANGCSGLAAFGTNSEANSLNAEERMTLLEYLVANGVSASALMPGTGCCALIDTVRLTAHAVALGCAGALMLPPFYYKGVSDEGLFRSYSEVIERVGDARLRVYLYHIPPVAQVGISIPLIERLLKRYSGTIAGIKDSSGDWNNTQALLDAFRGSAFDVFAGSESFLLANMRNGGVGCISALANVNAAAIHRVYANWSGADADALQQAVTATRAIVQKYPVIPSLKAIIARGFSDDGWLTVRPPLVELSAAQRDQLAADLDAHGFAVSAEAVTA